MIRYVLSRQERAAMAERLRAARHVAKLTEVEVAKALGVSRNSVIAWERGSLPAEATRSALAELYNIDEQVLFAEHYAKIGQALAVLRPA